MTIRLRGLLEEEWQLHWHRAQPSVMALTPEVSGSSRRKKGWQVSQVKEWPLKKDMSMS